MRALWSPAGKGLTSWLSFVVFNCEFVTFPLVSCVRCGTWLYRFLIFAPLLTLTQILMSLDMRFPTIWYVWPANPQISLRIRAVWSGPLLVAWILYDCKATDKTSFGVSPLKSRLDRLEWVYTCQNATLLKSIYHGSFEVTISIFLEFSS